MASRPFVHGSGRGPRLPPCHRGSDWGLGVQLVPPGTEGRVGGWRPTKVLLERGRDGEAGPRENEWASSGISFSVAAGGSSRVLRFPSCHGLHRPHGVSDGIPAGKGTAAGKKTTTGHGAPCGQGGHQHIKVVCPAASWRRARHSGLGAVGLWPSPPPPPREVTVDQRHQDRGDPTEANPVSGEALQETRMPRRRRERVGGGGDRSRVEGGTTRGREANRGA